MPESNSSSLSTFADELLVRAAQSGVRAVLVVSGNAGWCRQSAIQLLRGWDMTPTTWLGSDPAEGTAPLSWDRARTRLGRETGCLVIDAHEGFDAEGFGALIGTVRAGGLMLLMIPPLDEWPVRTDPENRRIASYPHSAADVGGSFVARFIKVLEEMDGVAIFRQGGPLPVLPPPLALEQQRARVESIYANDEQRRAVEAIHRVVTGHTRQPLVLSADRGRGKSAALGIAAAQQLQTGIERIIVTAPRIAAVDALFEHAAALLPGCEIHRGRLLWQGRVIEFVAPDALLRVRRKATLLLVDEAAAIPASLLSGLLRQHSRIVFATTVHGYEGTGRGFALRFQRTLDQQAPGWRTLQLSEPVRWNEGDSLEKLGFASLLLDADPVDKTLVSSADATNCSFECLETEQLATCETDLRELFGLLVLAHYRTSPNDLRQMLDAPGQSLYVLRHKGHIVAVTWISHEGGLEEGLARQVMLGRRRVRGHLLAQSLANHAGLAEAAERRIARIMRIAVHPSLQRRGLGGMLLQQIKNDLQAEGNDLLGASFGADVSLFRFWFREGWLPVRLGLKREASSGSHAVMLLTPISSAGEALLSVARERFAASLPELLAEPLSGLESELADALLAVTPPVQQSEIDRYDRSDLESFASGLRGYENCMSAIRKLVLQAWSDQIAQQALDATQRQLLDEKVLQRHSWQQLARQHGMSGRKAALEAVRKAVESLFRHYGANG